MLKPDSFGVKTDHLIEFESFDDFIVESLSDDFWIITEVLDIDHFRESKEYLVFSIERSIEKFIPKNSILYTLNFPSTIQNSSFFAIKRRLCYYDSMFFSKREPLFIRKLKKLIEAMAVGTGIILFWRGVWLLADTYLYPEYSGVSASISLFIGMLILLLTRSFVKQFLGEMQEQELKAEKNLFEKFLKH